MANQYKPETAYLVLDLKTKAGRLAAKTFAYVMLTSREPEDRELGKAILKEIEPWDN